MLVRGAAGVGKTRLLTDTIGTVDANVVAWGRCTRLHNGAPLGPLTDALMSATRDMTAPTVDALGPFGAALGAVVPHWSSAGRSADGSPAVVGEAVCRLLEHLAGAGTATLVVEDLHWSDPDTVAVLGYIVRHLDGLRVCVVLSARDGEPGEPAGLAEIAESTAIVELCPLSPIEVREMAAACLDVEDVPAAVVDHLDTEAGGLPLLIEDLLAADRRSAPRRFTQVVLDRLDALPHTSRSILEVAAIAGDEISIELVATAGDVSQAKVSEALHHGAARQLLASDSDGLRFRHAVTTDIIVSSLDVTARQEHCRRVAAALASQDPPDRGGAGELWLAAGDTGEAAGCFFAAAQNAAATGRVHSAAELFERVLDIAGDPDVRAAATTGLLACLVDAGHVDRVIAVAGAALDRVPPSSDDATSLRFTLGWAHIQRRERDPATIHLDAARRGRPTDPAALARLRLCEAQLIHRL